MIRWANKLKGSFEPTVSNAAYRTNARFDVHFCISL